MPRVSQTTQQIVRAGLNPVLTAPNALGAGNGDVVDLDNVFLYVNNASGGPITVTVLSPITQDGLALSSLAVSVPAAGFRLIGPLPSRSFANPAGGLDAGRGYVEYSAVASVTRAVVSF